MSLSVLMTSHNRREKTLESLRRLFAQEAVDSLDIQVFLVDADSSDGTHEAIKQQFPRTVLLGADNSIFWNRGMYLAFEAAKRDDYDFYLWLNDDTMLIEDALSRFLITEKKLRDEGHHPGILVGSTADPVTGELTYGGLNQVSRLNPLRLERSNVSVAPKRVDTMNGNCVLITREASKAVGNLDWRFIHGMGDVDYGLRAKKLGVEIWTVPGVIGHCAQNGIRGSWQDESLPFLQRWRKLLGPKGLPPKSWFVLTRRHGGLIWPLLWARPYCMLMLDSALDSLRSRVRGVGRDQAGR